MTDRNDLAAAIDARIRIFAVALAAEWDRGTSFCEDIAKALAALARSAPQEAAPFDASRRVGPVSRVFNPAHTLKGPRFERAQEAASAPSEAGVFERMGLPETPPIPSAPSEAATPPAQEPIAGHEDPAACALANKHLIAAKAEVARLTEALGRESDAVAGERYGAEVQKARADRAEADRDALMEAINAAAERASSYNSGQPLTVTEMVTLLGKVSKRLVRDADEARAELAALRLQGSAAQQREADVAWLRDLAVACSAPCVGYACPKCKPLRDAADALAAAPLASAKEQP